VIPYGRQSIDEADIAAIVEVLRSAWLTTGPKVGEFEAAFAQSTGAAHAVAVNSGTAALHAAMDAHGIGPGDEVIVPANTFVASANAVLYVGATPVFADVEPDTLLIDPADAAAKITPRTRGVIAVDFAGQPCDYAALQALTDRHGLFLHADACHALGANFGERKVGTLARTNSFSFHPVKPITTAEGGMVTTDDAELAARMRTFRNHGITLDFRQREKAQTWEYDMESLGWNYRLSDLQCALGITQLARTDEFFQRRNAVADAYDAAFAGLGWIERPARAPGRTHAFHLYPCRITDRSPISQREAFQKLRAEGIGVHIMYRPVYQHSYYRGELGYADGQCPVAENAYQHVLTLPIFSAIDDAQVARVIEAIVEIEA
jgi:perosamine synthetase